MTPEERAMLFSLNDAVQALNTVAQQQQEVIGQLQEALKTVGPAVSEVYADARLTSVVCGALIAEIAADRAHLDEFLSKTLVTAESVSANMEGPARRISLQAIDRIIDAAEFYMGQKKR